MSVSSVAELNPDVSTVTDDGVSSQNEYYSDNLPKFETLQVAHPNEELPNTAQVNLIANRILLLFDIRLRDSVLITLFQ